MRITVDHTTHYTYDKPVRHSAQYSRLVPPDNSRQRVVEWKLDTPGTSMNTQDGYGNIVNLLTIDRPVSEIVIRARGTVETTPAIDEAIDAVALSPLLFLRPSLLTAAGPGIVDFAEPYRRRIGTLSGLRQLADAVLAKLPFTPGVTGVESTADHAFAGESGVCQDHAHVFLACCRHLGVPARYVSGYVYAPDFMEAHVATHAWVEAWVVDRWRSFDITNGGPAGEQHVRLAIGSDYLDACPVRGMRSGGGTETMVATAQVQEAQ